MSFDRDALSWRLVVIGAVMTGIVQWSSFLSLDVGEAEVVKVLSRSRGGKGGPISSTIVRYDVPDRGTMEQLYVMRSSPVVGDRIKIRYEAAKPEQPLDAHPGIWQLGPVAVVLIGIYMLVFTVSE